MPYQSVRQWKCVKLALDSLNNVLLPLYFRLSLQQTTHKKKVNQIYKMAYYSVRSWKRSSNLACQSPGWRLSSVTVYWPLLPGAVHHLRLTFGCLLTECIMILQEQYYILGEKKIIWTDFQVEEEVKHTRQSTEPFSSPQIALVTSRISWISVRINRDFSESLKMPDLKRFDLAEFYCAQNITEVRVVLLLQFLVSKLVIDSPCW